MGGFQLEYGAKLLILMTIMLLSKNILIINRLENVLMPKWRSFTLNGVIQQLLISLYKISLF